MEIEIKIKEMNKKFKIFKNSTFEIHSFEIQKNIKLFPSRIIIKC